jgi:hypothetical protein
MREGLLQEHRSLDRLRQSPVLEVGGFVGLILILLGVYLGLVLVARWGDVDFGTLASPGRYLRTVSLATLLLTLGGLTTLFSLVMGFLALPTRGERAR